MVVVPILFGLDPLCGHVSFVHLQGSQEGLARFFVFAHTPVNMSRHVNQVARAGGQAREHVGAGKRVLRMRAGLQRVDPIMVCRGVVGVGSQEFMQNSLGIEFASRGRPSGS